MSRSDCVAAPGDWKRPCSGKHGRRRKSPGTALSFQFDQEGVCCGNQLLSQHGDSQAGSTASQRETRSTALFQHCMGRSMTAGYAQYCSSTAGCGEALEVKD